MYRHLKLDFSRFILYVNVTKNVKNSVKNNLNKYSYSDKKTI